MADSGKAADTALTYAKAGVDIDAGNALVEASLVVVEVTGSGVVAEADVDPQIGRRQRPRPTRADDLSGAVEELERGDREHLVRVEGAVMGGDHHRARL